MICVKDLLKVIYKVQYPKRIKIPGFEQSTEETVRLLLLVWTADQPGQCKMGKFLNQGKCACHRCKLAGEHLENGTNTHYFYGQNHLHSRHP